MIAPTEDDAGGPRGSQEYIAAAKLVTDPVRAGFHFHNSPVSILP